MQNEQDNQQQQFQPPQEQPQPQIQPETQKTLPVYNKSARQTFKLAGEDDEQRYELTFAIENLEDDILFQYDALTEVQTIRRGKNRIQKTNTLAASSWLFENHIQLVDGFEGEKLPPNWKDDFDDNEREEIVGALLYTDVAVQDRAKTLGKRQFGKAKAGNVITIKAAFNGEQTLVKFDFPPKNNDQVGKFRKLLTGAEYKRGREGTFQQPLMEKLCELSREIGVKVLEGANPAAHITSLAMLERFDANLEQQTKKLNL